MYPVAMLELDCGQDFQIGSEERFFEALPSRPGVILIEMRDGSAEPYIARTADIRRISERLLRAAEIPSKRLNLREVAARIHFRVTGSKFEQAVSFYREAKRRLPNRYRDLLRLRGPALLKVNLASAYPRCYVTRRIRADGGLYFGPFASRRSAETFAEGFLDLFKIRRCQIKIRRDPAFPGCIYSQMKMCLAPCFAGCTKEEYDAELGRVVGALSTSGASLTESLERDREAASEALDFEKAAALHKRIEKASDALRGLPEIARKVDELDAVILTRAAEEKTILVFPVRAGFLEEPARLCFGEISSEPRSVEAILRRTLEEKVGSAANATAGSRDDYPSGGAAVLPHAESAHANRLIAPDTPETFSQAPPVSSGSQSAPNELSEQLTLIARWFYSKPREGEILFRDDDWPYRRMLRACARLLSAPDQPQQLQ